MFLDADPDAGPGRWTWTSLDLDAGLIARFVRIGMSLATVYPLAGTCSRHSGDNDGFLGLDSS
jgi:hypothetical protein